MHAIDNEALLPYARKYVWWKSPEDAVRYPLRVVAQVMDVGDYADVLALGHTVGRDILQRALETAEPGWFSERSWTYWHYRLKLAKPGQTPPTPRRTFS